MSDTPTDQKPAASAKPAIQPDPAASPGISDLDEGLHAFWKKNGQAIQFAIGAALVILIGKYGWDAFARQRENGVQEEFAAANSPQKLQDFVTAHPDHPLAGIAQLEIADQDYASGNILGAASAYGQAATTLKTGPLAARAQLGLAMSQVQSGQQAEGESGLRQLSEDTHQAAPIRAEATYQLASLAASAGKADEVQKLALQLMQIDPNSAWAQRAFSLQVAKPAAPAAPMAPPPAAGTPAPSAAPATSGIQFKPSAH